MQAKDIMSTDVEIVGRNDTLLTVEELMINKKVRHILVLENGQVIGIISQRDLFKASMSSTMGIGEKAHKAYLRSVLAKEIMTYPVITTSPTASLKEVVDLMLQKGIGCVPVLEGTRLVGIITKTDLLRYLSEQEG